MKIDNNASSVVNRLSITPNSSNKILSFNGRRMYSIKKISSENKSSIKDNQIFYSILSLINCPCSSVGRASHS